MTFGDKMAQIFDHEERAVPRWAELLGGIMEDLARLERGLADMKIECLSLAESGMWPAVPTEMWESRNGGPAHLLRLYFPQGTPGVRTKTYIGCKPAAIADARRKAGNRVKWEELDREISRLERTLKYVMAAIGRAQSLVVSYRIRDLGTPAAPDLTIAVPKVEGEG